MREPGQRLGRLGHGAGGRCARLQSCAEGGAKLREALSLEVHCPPTQRGRSGEQDPCWDPPGLPPPAPTLDPAIKPLLSIGETPKPCWDPVTQPSLPPPGPDHTASYLSGSPGIPICSRQAPAPIKGTEGDSPLCPGPSHKRDSRRGLPRRTPATSQRLGRSPVSVHPSYSHIPGTHSRGPLKPPADPDTPLCPRAPWRRDGAAGKNGNPGHGSGPPASPGTIPPGPPSSGPARPRLSAPSDAPCVLFSWTLEGVYFQWRLLSFAQCEVGGSREGSGRYSCVSIGRPVSLGLRC